MVPILRTTSLPATTGLLESKAIPGGGTAAQQAPQFFGRVSGGVLIFGILVLAVNFLVRASLLARSAGEVDWNPITIVGVFATGALFDLITASYLALPLVAYLMILPARRPPRRWRRRILAGFFFIAIYLLLFAAVAEWLFWEEFGARFNFIAVDYLIYTNEVIGNIRESYSLPAIFGSLFLIASGIFFVVWTTSPMRIWLQHLQLQPWNLRERLKGLALCLAAPLLFTLCINGRQVPEFGNTYYQELARNGLYSFCSAYRNNELSYDQFYNTLPLHDSFNRLRQLTGSKDGAFASTNIFDVTREIVKPGPEKHWNVIQITVESLSAEFLGAYGNTERLTPNLDSLAEQSLFFTNFYATGTRTVRGMEALTLGLPPTPGQSIVRRPNNENLFTLGSVFQERGYDTAFIYGGYGYFDNMNYYFSKNGYRVIDRTSVASTNISFANVWGACDEDVFDWSMKEAELAFAQDRPFFHFVMTTSNHRPYTYPEGRIDIPSHTGREGGVKYTDYAIGRFLEKARARPWFTNTLFVIVADHCAASAGRTDLPIKRYEIPMMFYNPGLVPAGRIGTLSSQIDYPPTLLSLMNWSYRSRFVGKDILEMQPEEERAFIASYQKLGLLTRDKLAVLKPVRQRSIYSYERASGEVTLLEDDQKLVEDCIANYQSASYIFSHGLYGAFRKPEE